MKKLISPLDLTTGEIDQLLALSDRIIENPQEFAHKCDGKILATLFFEPSTRTRLSFESAMLRLGGKVLGFSSANSCSAAKGETVGDTARMAECYADIIAMRHPCEGAATAAAAKIHCPLINAGDGSHQHPTQTLTDLLTIHRLKGRLDDLTIGLCGDLKFGRTVHSLIRAMMRYKGIRFVLVSPQELKIPDYIRESMTAAGYPFEETEDLESAIGSMDILYMTRVQGERFANVDDYLRLRDHYILDAAKMKLAKDDMIVMHPLPRVNEISTEVDDDPRAAYFQQANFGRFVRMALILKMLEDESDSTGTLPQNTVILGDCTNPHCITQQEASLPRLYTRSEKGVCRCFYCEHEHID